MTVIEKSTALQNALKSGNKLEKTENEHYTNYYLVLGGGKTLKFFINKLTPDQASCVSVEYDFSCTPCNFRTLKAVGLYLNN